MAEKSEQLNTQFIRITNGSGVRFSDCFSVTVMHMFGDFREKLRCDESGDELLLRCMNSLRQREHLIER